MTDDRPMPEKDPLSPDSFADWYRTAAPPPPPGARDRLARRLAAERIEVVDGIGGAERAPVPATPLRRRRLSRWGLGVLGSGMLAAALALFVVLSRPDDASLPAVHALTSSVRIELHAPSAHEVALVGDFNQWSRETDRMRRDPEAGVWHAEVALPPGRHAYAFVVDGTRWTIDPRAPQAALSDFGATNVMLVATR